MPSNAQAIPLAERRKDFLGKAILRSQTLPRKTYADGATIEFILPHAGFGAFCVVDFDGTMAVGGAGGSIALSDDGIHKLYNKVSFDDYLGINRISCSGLDLHQIRILRKWAFDENNSNLSQPYSNLRYEASVGGGTGAVGNYPWKSTEIIPIALHENTTEGTFPFTLPNGDNVISLTFNTIKATNNDAVIKETTGGFTTTLTGTVGLTYYYWDIPVGVALPIEDFQLVHEIRRTKETTGLTAGDEKRYTLRTGRTYYQVIQNLRINDAGDTADVTKINFYVDGDTSTLNETLVAYLDRTYSQYGRDLEPGVFVWNFFRKPWTPNDYGSLETSLELSDSVNVTGNSYVAVCMESMYRTGKILADLASMPGAQQA